MWNIKLTQKILMALTGLFLCFFLVIHLAGNLQLFLPPVRAQAYFNHYSEILSGNIIIELVAYVLYSCILAHAFLSLVLTVKSKRSGGGYQKDRRGRASKWYSRNMGFLGTIILFFLIVHLANFWYVYKFGRMPIDPYGRKDLYTVVVAVFSEWWYVLIYTLGMIALCFHLLHGVYSATRTLGLYHPKYVLWFKYIGVAYSLVISIGFTIIPIYVYLNS